MTWLSEEKWIELINRVHKLMRNTEIHARNKLSDLIMSGVSSGSQEAKELQLVINRCAAIYRCNKYREEAESRWTCRNRHFCENCNRRMRQFLAKQVGKYLSKARKSKLYAYTRKEDFLVPIENTDWDYIKNKCIPFLIRRRGRLYTVLSQGTAQCLGASNRIEVINNSYYDGYISVRLTSLLVFDEKKVYSMSAYWTQREVFEENSDGIPIHKATLEYSGCMDSESKAYHIINEVFPARLYTYTRMGEEAVINIIKVFHRVFTWNQCGPVFKEGNKSKTKKYKNRDRILVEGEPLYKDSLYDLSE